MLSFVTHSEGETQELGAKLAREVYFGTNILLFGDLGVGKTRFSQGFFAALGVEESVKSPTFTFHKIYNAHGKTVHHLDLYRLEGQTDGSEFSLQELFESDETVLVEWAERLSVLPKKRIKVRFFALSDLERRIEISFHGFSPSHAEIHALIDEFHVPTNVRAHCGQVAKVADETAQGLVSRGEIVDLDLVHAAGMLHDLVRVSDFHELDRNSRQFVEPISDEKWSFWLSLREKYKGRHHADSAAEILAARGWKELAEVISKHKSRVILNAEDAPKTWAEKCVHYGDRRVVHDRIVSLAERFSDSKERHGTPPEMADLMEKEMYRIEKELLGVT